MDVLRVAILAMFRGGVEEEVNGLGKNEKEGEVECLEV